MRSPLAHTRAFAESDDATSEAVVDSNAANNATGDADAADGSAETAAPDYGFEGYSIDFNDKFALLPPQSSQTARAQSLRARRG